MTHSGLLPDQTAMRSPGEKRCSSARAARSASARSARYVHRRRGPQAASPSMSAILSGARAAASHSADPIVVSRSGVNGCAGQYALVSGNSGMTPTSRPHTRRSAADVTPAARGGEEPKEQAEQRAVRTDGAFEFDWLLLNSRSGPINLTDVLI